MCGIVGGVANRRISKILIEGLKRLEYRGYDSAGIAVLEGNELAICKKSGKVARLEAAVLEKDYTSTTGIAHTRWATHGKPCEENAHPHTSNNAIALVHNGIIENYQELKQKLSAQGYCFVSETDTESVVHLLAYQYEIDKQLLPAVQNIIPQLEGAYGLAVIHKDEPNTLVVARSGSPLVIGLGIDENFIASDQLALRQVTDRFIYLEEGDIAEITPYSYRIFNQGIEVERSISQMSDAAESSDKGEYRHFMLKEIYEQPNVVRNTMEGRIDAKTILADIFTGKAEQLLQQVEQVQIIACGTSYHAGMVAKYWIENYTNVQCLIEVASEYRYRKVVVRPNTLLVTITQSGETADTLAALKMSKEQGYLASVSVCNVAQSSIVRESDFTILTHAGPEIGVASTKAFTTQLVALLLLTLHIAKQRSDMTPLEIERILQSLQELPVHIEQVLALNKTIEKTFESFIDKSHALFLGRGIMYPVALEGALKLKEISYIHAEAYPAGELKHGPLALVDDNMPVVAVAPNNELLEKLKSNLEEVHARGGKLFVFADKGIKLSESPGITVIHLPSVPEVLAPIVYTVPLQLLSYHVAVMKGTDVDQPRNLAKSVTVE